MFEQARHAEETQHLRDQELESLFSIASFLAEARTFEEKAARILDVVAQIAQADIATLRIFRQDEGTFDLVAAVGLPQDQHWPESLPLSSQSGLAAQRREAVVDNAYALDQLRTLFPVYHIVRSLVSLPLMSHGQVLGVINVISAELGHFTPDMVRLLSAIGGGLGVLLENAGLRQQLQATEAEMAVVDQVARIITSTLDIDQVYEEFAKEVKKLVPADRLGINLIDNENGVFICHHLVDEAHPATEPRPAWPLEGSHTQRVAETGEAFIQRDLSSGPSNLAEGDMLGLGLRSTIALPLKSKGRVTGSLFVGSRKTGSYGPREQAILERLAGQIAPAVENARLYQEARKAESDARLRTAESETLVRISRILTEPGAFALKAKAVLDELTRAAQADWAFLWVADEPAQWLRLVASTGTEIQMGPADQLIPYDAGIVGAAFATGEPVVANTYDEHPEALEAWIHSDQESAMAIPLATPEGPMGIFAIASRNVDHFTPGRIRMLAAIGHGLGVLLENAGLYRQIQAATAELAVVDQVARIITSTLDMNRVYQEFAGEVKKLVDFDEMTITRIEPGHRTMAFEAVYRPGEIAVAGVDQNGVVPLESTQTAHVAMTGCSLVREDLASDSRFALDPLTLEAGLRSSIMVPLSAAGRVIGGMILLDRRVGAYQEREQIILERLASQIAPAVENARIFDLTKRAEEALRISEAEAKRLAYENAMLAEIGRIVTSSLNLTEIYDRFVQEVGKLIVLDRIVITTPDENQTTVHVSDLTTGVAVPGHHSGNAIPLAGSIAAEVVRTQQGLLYNVDDFDEATRQFPKIAPHIQAGLMSFLAAPLISQDRVIAVLQIQAKRKHAYSDDDLRLANGIGVQISGAVANSHLYAERIRVEEELRETEERNRDLAAFPQLSPDPVVRFDRDGLILWANPAAIETLGPITALPTTLVSVLPGLAGLDLAECISRGLVVTLESQVGDRYFQLAVRGVPELGIGHIYGTDITVRRLAEESNREMALFAQLNPAPVLRFDANGSVLSANSAAIDILGGNENGYAPLSSVLPGVASLDLKQLIELGAVVYHEAHVGGKDFQLVLCGVPELGVGQLYGTDITQRKRTEEKLRASEERYRAMADSAVDAVISADADGNIVSWNRAAQAIFGYDQEEVLGRPLALLIPKDYREAHRKELERLRATGEAYVVGETVELRGLRKGGAEFPLELSLCSWKTGEGTFLTGTIRDITDRKHLEEELRKISQAVEQSPFGVVITDVKGKIEYVNARLTQITGYSSEELVGSSTAILGSGATSPEEYRRIWDTLNCGEEWRGELLNRRKNGEPLWVLENISPIRSPSGGITHFVGIQEDVTERKFLEEQLSQSQKMDSMGQLASGVAHDFNNLLTAIIGYAHLGSAALPRENPVTDHLQAIKQAAERAADLTNQLLVFSRRQPIAPKVLDLNHLIIDFDRMLRRLLGANIELVVLLAPDLKPIKADPTQMEQVLMNLAVNAKDAMSNNGKLIIETSNVTLNRSQVSYLADLTPGEYVMLSVTDSGEGIPEDVKSRIFEPFFTTKGIGKGTGLGLATCYGFVKQSGGHIEVESEPSQGATFRMYLPKTDAVASNPDDNAKKSPAVRGTETVLLAEDEPLILTMVSRTLRDQGYRVLESTNGEEALRVAEEHGLEHIDVLVTDIVMPRMGGLELADRIRIMRHDLKIVFTSGYTDKTVFTHGEQEPGVAFLPKPFLPEDLAVKVRSVLD